MDYTMLFLNIPIVTEFPDIPVEKSDIKLGNRYVWINGSKPKEICDFLSEVRLHHRIHKDSKYALTLYKGNGEEIVVNLKKSKNVAKTVIVSSENLEDIDRKISLKKMVSVGISPFEEELKFILNGKILVFDFTKVDDDDHDDLIKDLMS